MTGRRSHGRLSALNGVVHQGTSDPVGAAVRTKRSRSKRDRYRSGHGEEEFGGKRKDLPATDSTSPALLLSRHREGCGGATEPETSTAPEPEPESEPEPEPGFPAHAGIYPTRSPRR